MHEGLQEEYLQPGHPTTPMGCPFLVLTYLVDEVSLAAGMQDWSSALNPTGKTALLGLMALAEGFAQGQKDMTFPRDRALQKGLLLFPTRGEFLAPDTAALLFSRWSLIVWGWLWLPAPACASGLHPWLSEDSVQ